MRREGRHPEAERQALAGAGRGGGHVDARALGKHVGAVLVAVRREQRELLAAHARGGVEAALHPAERGGHHAQRVVAGRVPEPLVHAREAVHVEHHEAERRAAAAGALELEVEGVLEAAPVRKLGERVAGGELGQPLAGADQPVAEHRHHEAADRERPDRGDPAVHLGAAGVLEPQHQPVADRHQAHVHERGAQPEEVEDEEHDPQVGQRRVAGRRAPRVDGGARERDAEDRDQVEAGHRHPVARRHERQRQRHRQHRHDHEQVLVADRRVRRGGRDQPESGSEQAEQRARAGGAGAHARRFTSPSGITQAKSLA